MDSYASVLFVKKAEIFEHTRTDFQHMKPYSEKLRVKIGPLRALPSHAMASPEPGAYIDDGVRGKNRVQSCAACKTRTTMIESASGWKKTR